MKEFFNKSPSFPAAVTGLEKAVALGKGEAALKLLEDFPALAKHVFANDENVLHLAARLRDGGRALQKALSMNGDIHTKNAQGETPLLVASVGGDGGVIGALLQAGAPLHAFDDAGINATMRAIRSSNLDAATALLQAGGHVDSEDSAVEEQIGVAWEKILPDFCKALDAQQKRQKPEETQSLKNAKAERIKAAVVKGASTRNAPKTASFRKK